MSYNPTASQSLHKYNVLNYGASCSSFQTTGSITSGQSSLVVAETNTFLIGQGICILGAGTSGANLVTTISNIVGTTITLATTAGGTVTNAVVIHDDTNAVNAAIADAYSKNGGVIYFPQNGPSGCDGWCRLSGPFNAATNSIVTFPQNLTYIGTPKIIKFEGEICGWSNSSGGIGGGCVLDFTNSAAGSGTLPSAIAAAPYVVSTNSNYTTIFNNVSFDIDNLAIVVPNQTTICGINMANAMQTIIGNRVLIFSLASGGAWSPNGNNTIGILFPQFNNNVQLICGAAEIVGFTTGIIAGEHQILNNPFINLCNFAMQMAWQSQHVYSGIVTIQDCIQVLYVGVGFSYPSSVLLTLDVSLSGSGSFARGGTDIEDTGDFLKGVLYIKGTGSLNISGGSNITPIFI